MTNSAATTPETIAICGHKGSPAWQAARDFAPDANIIIFPDRQQATAAFNDGQADHLLLPVYSSRSGNILGSFQAMATSKGAWIDNIVLPVHLSLASLDDKKELKIIIGSKATLRQCEEYLNRTYPDLSLLAVTDLKREIKEIKDNNLTDRGILAEEEIVSAHDLHVRQRDVLPHQKTRFAIIGNKPRSRTGYDATSIISVPLRDRVGMLYDALGEFSKRGINLLDLRAETDAKTEELQIYLEIAGHLEDQGVQQAIDKIENQVIQEAGCIKILGSYPRVDMRVKKIRKFGFIGTGSMSQWFAGRLEGEGYETVLTGRSTSTKPEDMIPDIDVLIICVPISKTRETISKYCPLLTEKQGLILLAGEAENILNTAVDKCRPGVEIMLVHNLWGPAAATMKDKNASVVKTASSGPLCSEFEGFLYKHGAAIIHDSANQHDLFMGVGQKLPTTISMAMAMALDQNKITPDDISSHTTLTSLYGILAMARIHFQNPQTYAEIMATKGDGQKIVRNFAENLLQLIDLAEAGDIPAMIEIINKNRTYLGDQFLTTSMQQALAVDQTLGKISKP